MNDIAMYRTLASEFIDASNQFQRTKDKPRLERLRESRLKIVTALLDVPAAAVQEAFAGTLASVFASYSGSDLRLIPRTPAENEVFARCLNNLKSLQPEQGAIQGIAALLLARHAFELKFVPSIVALPLWLRPLWLTFLFELPSAFADFGDADAFAQYLGMLCDRIGECFAHASDPATDVIAAFNGSAMFMQSYFNELNLRDTMRARGKIIEWILERNGETLDQLRVLRPARARPRIGFVAHYVVDGTETTFLAAHMERLDRRHYDVRLYSLSEPVGNMGRVCRAAAETCMRLPEKVQDAVTRLRCEDLDLAIFSTNLTAVNHALTQIAAHRVARVQVSTIASPVTTGLRNMDVMISGETNETADSQTHYTEQLICLPGALNCYPFHYILEGLPDPGPTSRTSLGLGIPEQCTLFFSSANFYKILPDLSQQWISILQQVPNSYLLLMPFNPNWSPNYPMSSFVTRLSYQMSQANLAPERIRLQARVPTIAHLQKILALADIYLDSFPFSGACSIYDPLMVGIPIVARAGKVCRSRHSAAILEEAGLGDWVAPDNESYVRAAVALGNSPEKRHAERERLARAREKGLRLSDTTAYAAKLTPLFDGVLSDWNKKVEASHRIDPTHLKRRIDELSRQVGKRVPSFTDQVLVESVALPYLRSGRSPRLIDVGACFGTVTKPFLDEGWQAVMFEPDTRCHSQLTALAKMYPGRAHLEKAAVTAGLEKSIAFHLASLPGLSGLSHSPYAPDVATIEVPGIALAEFIASKGWDDVDFIKIDAEGYDLDILQSIDFKQVSPRLVMVEFGDQFAGQGRESICAALQGMQSRGYRACVVCLRALGNFERHEWGTQLLAIGVDGVPAVAAEERLFGNILFFPEADSDFLPSVYDWLEHLHKWH